jgi:hypothetical protein
VALAAATKFLLVSIMLAVLTNVLLAQNLYVIEKDDFYGFSDKSGTQVISPKYGLVKTFSEGLAPVYVSGSWGYVDSEGQMKIEPHLWDADSFSEGLAAIRQNRGWGYIDGIGKLVIQPQYLQARKFSEGLAPVRDVTGWLFVDKTGTQVPGLSGFDDAMGFKDGLAAVKVNGKWRFINQKGKKNFDLEFVKVKSFGQQLAAVQAKESGKYGFIDKTGKYIIQPVFEDAKEFSEDLAAVRLSGMWGYVNKNGEMKIANNYPLFAEQFRNGLALVSDPVRGAKMYINADGIPQFFSSDKSAQFERGTDAYTYSTLKLSSEPTKADVYLIPAIIWDQGFRNQAPPSQLTQLELQAYLKKHFEFKQGKTYVEPTVIEQTYVALFCLGSNIEMRKWNIPVGESSYTVSFGDK